MFISVTEALNSESNPDSEDSNCNKKTAMPAILSSSNSSRLSSKHLLFNSEKIGANLTVANSESIASNFTTTANERQNGVVVGANADYSSMSLGVGPLWWS